MYDLELVHICKIKTNNVLSRDKDIKKLIFEVTSFLDPDVGVADRVYYIENGIYQQLICPVCKIGKSRPDKSNNRIKSCSAKCANNRIDLETGLTKKEAISIKLKKQRLELDPETGLTKSAMIGLKQKANKNRIDPDNGLTFGENKRLKKNETYNNINNETGLTIRETSKLKLSVTLNSKQLSGLTLAEEIGRKAADTKSKIDHSTGLSWHHTITRKSAETMKKIGSDGFTIFEKSGKKISKLSSEKSILSKVNNFPIGYKLLTTPTEYENNKILKYSCNKCGSIRQSFWPHIRCTTCYPYNKSIGENEVLEFCQSLTSNIQSNSRNIIPPLEIDIYLPDHNLAIEYNGIYWHSSDSTENEAKDYHLHKTQQCDSKNIQLFHIFENEWLDPQKQIIWKSIISNRLGKSSRIFARKTEVRSVTSGDTREFLKSNHLQGSCVSSVNLGLYFEGRLVSIMTFGKSRYDKSMDWEMIRFCNEIGISVVGGASKLLSWFTLNNKGSIISYADKRRSKGNLYERLGFSLSHESGPNYFYWKDQGLESRIKFQKHKLPELLEEYDGDLTESENMYVNGYRKIFDCGNQVWRIDAKVE